MSKSTELDRNVKLYLLKAIETDSEGNKYSMMGSLDHITQRFHGEAQWNIDRKGEQAAMTEWLQGLAINIAHERYEIRELVTKWGSIPQGATEEHNQKILDNYWHFMATKLLQMLRGYKIPQQRRTVTSVAGDQL